MNIIQVLLAYCFSQTREVGKYLISEFCNLSLEKHFLKKKGTTTTFFPLIIHNPSRSCLWKKSNLSHA